MWWQHSRSAGVIVAPGRTHAIAGVIAHSKAIVSSANARVLVIFMIVLLPLTTRNNGYYSNYNLSSPLTMADVTVITGLRRGLTNSGWAGRDQRHDG